VEETDEESSYIRQWVTVNWRPGDPIYLYVVRPKGITKPPAVIYLYDYPAETDIFRDDDWSTAATAGGYAAIGFVPALNGHRFHDRPLKQWFVSEMQEALAESAHDVQMVLNYLAQRGDVDAGHVGIFGVGAGATIAIMAASADARIKTLDLWDPWGDWLVWTAKSEVIPDDERPQYVKPEFLNKVAAFDPVALLPQLKNVTIRYGAPVVATGSVPQDAEKKIESSLPNQAEPVRYKPGTDLSGTAGARPFAWIKEQLKPAAAKKNDARLATKR
jgi:hypothetical protein